MTADTLFDCASLSKSLTAAAVSLLVDDNEKYPEVDWSTPVSRLLRDDFVLEDPYATENVTVEDILSHRSGMPRQEYICCIATTLPFIVPANCPSFIGMMNHT